MQNPYRLLRDEARISQKDFATRYDLSKTTLIYVESGQYPSLSAHLIDSIADICVERNVDAAQLLSDLYNAETLNEAYNTWQTNERISVAHLFQSPPARSERIGGPSPMTLFIEQVSPSVQGFCKLLKIPSPTLMRYAKGTTANMPSAIRTALEEVRYPYIEELSRLQEEWRG